MTEKNKELIEVLLALSALSKRLAKKLSKVENSNQHSCRTETHRILNIDGNQDRPTTINNYYTDDHSRTINQTNNSPKALSRL